jgi:hypothetical protein
MYTPDGEKLMDKCYVKKNPVILFPKIEVLLEVFHLGWIAGIYI